MILLVVDALAQRSGRSSRADHAEPTCAGHCEAEEAGCDGKSSVVVFFLRLQS